MPNVVKRQRQGKSQFKPSQWYMSFTNFDKVGFLVKRYVGIGFIFYIILFKFH